MVVSFETKKLTDINQWLEDGGRSKVVKMEATEE